MCHTGLPRYWVHLAGLGSIMEPLIPRRGPKALNPIPTHNPQKVGHHGLSGVSALRMEPRAGAGAVRSLFQGRVPVLATVARAGPAPTARFLVGPSATTSH
jgi:hypothetical protein